MKAVVMAGGHGTRLRPSLASPINKHLYPVGGKPLIHWPLLTLNQIGVDQVLVMLNGDNSHLLMEAIGIGSAFGFSVYYSYSKEVYGPNVGKTLYQAMEFTANEPFLLILGDSVYLKAPNISHINPHHMWVMEPDPDWDDMEKYPAVPNQVDYLQTGMWFFGPSIFQVIGDLWERSEVRIRNLVEELSNRQEPIEYTIISPRSFIDCGTRSAIRKVDNLIQ